VIVVRGAQGKGVVGAAIGAGGARARVKHGGSLCASAQASSVVASGGMGTTRDVDEGGCWGDYSRWGRAPSGCDGRDREARGMRRREGRLVTTRAARAVR